MQVKGTPSWVERGLNMIDGGGSQILLIDQMSNHSSAPDVGNHKSGYDPDKCTYLLGQNIHIEPNIKAERECKRLKALELQTAIMQQLEERERKKREEKERRLKEERDEEERFKRHLDIERQRLEEERRISEEKQQREQRRAEALRQALEKAEQMARIEKENKKLKKMRDNFDSMSICSEMDPPKDSHYSRKGSMSQQSNPYNESKLIQNIYIEQAFSPRRKIISDQDTIPHNMTSETNIIMSNPQSARYNRQLDHFANDQSVDINRRNENQRQHSDNTNTTYQSNPPINVMTEAPVSLVQIPVGHEMLAPVHYTHGSSVQMAFLMPQHMNSIYPCLHQPINMQTMFPPDASFIHHRNLQMQSQTDTDDCCSNRENKVLTPSKYRNQNSRDVCTQTDFEYKVKPKPGQSPEEDEEFKIKSVSTLEQNYEQNTSEEKLNSLSMKKDKRTEEKYKDTERPKWGVNKPPTQYKKQSEKDIFYPQKRKLRQRKRIQEKNYTSHSSDENRSPSPPRDLPKGFPKLDRNRVSLSESYWRKKNMKNDKDINNSNITIETTEISPLECDQMGIVRIGENFSNKKKVYSESKKRGMTLSQKFMNDKYGNPKLWNGNSASEDKTNQRRDVKEEQNIKFKEKTDHRKQYLDSVNRAKKEQSAYYCEGETNQPIILDQLRSLRDSLKKQQQLWGKYDPNNRSPSPKNDVDMEME